MQGCLSFFSIWKSFTTALMDVHIRRRQEAYLELLINVVSEQPKIRLWAALRLFTSELASPTFYVGLLPS